MILYCDTSALVKRYVKEDHSEEVDRLWGEALMIATSSVALAEGLAAFCRKLREGMLTESGWRKTAALFKKEHELILRVNVTSELDAVVSEMIERHPLRGFDAIHLASAVYLASRSGVPVRFACYDGVLSDAARAEGLA